MIYILTRTNLTRIDLKQEVILASESFSKLSAQKAILEQQQSIKYNNPNIKEYTWNIEELETI